MTALAIELGRDEIIVAIEPGSAESRTIYTIDGQHGTYLKAAAACRLALYGELAIPKGKKVRLATLDRPDPDAIVTFLILQAQAEGNNDVVKLWRERILRVAGYDEFTLDPADNKADYREFCALSDVCNNIKVEPDLDKRIAIVRDWLDRGADAIPAVYYEEHDKLDAEVKRLWAEELIELSDDMVLVQGANAYRGIIPVLYQYGPVVVIEYPDFYGTRRVTVARHKSFARDLRPLWSALAKHENALLDTPLPDDGNWGGSNELGGSPFKRDCVTPFEIIVEETENVLNRPSIGAFRAWLLENEWNTVGSADVNPYYVFCRKAFGWKTPQLKLESFSLEEQLVVTMLSRELASAPANYQIAGGHVGQLLARMHQHMGML